MPTCFAARAVGAVAKQEKREKEWGGDVCVSGEDKVEGTGNSVGKTTRMRP